MERYRLHLFGSFRLDLDNNALTGFRSDKVRVLLAYLVVEGGKGPIRRDTLASLLWDGYTPETARHSLRTALHNLRQLLSPADLLQTTRQTVQIDTAHPAFWCDALALEALLRQMAAAPEHEALARRHEWLASQAQYQGGFLDGLNLPDSPAFEAWKAAKRAYFAEQITVARRRLDRLIARHQPGLPRSTTPFFGRDQELTELRLKILDPDYPLITVIGEGGVGKTRLALEAARQVSEHFADGVWFVPLLDVKTAPSAVTDESSPAPTAFSSLAVAVGHAVGLSFNSRSSPVKQLFDHLRDKEMLLVLDNFEHLVAAARFVADLALAAPGVTILVTSRQSLGLQMEWVCRLHGLPAPDYPITMERARTSGWSSLQLFAERAARRPDGFILNAENLPHVVEICRSVGGLPLAIELAAALTDRESCRDIARAVRNQLTQLATTMQDLPPRHHSLRAVFDHSWHLLSAAEAHLLAQCSIFRDGFTAEAVPHVAAATPGQLTALVDKSLLQQDDAGRYSMHPLTRQMAAERLAAGQHGDRQHVWARHSAYYLTLAGDLEAAIFRSDAEALRQMRAEFANIHQAWDQALADGASALIDHSMVALYEYCHLVGLSEEAIDLFTAAVERMRRWQQLAPTGSDPGPDQVLSCLLALLASFLERSGQAQQADATIEEALQGARTAKARTLALLNKAELLIMRSQAGPEAYTLLEDALVQVRAWSNPIIETMVLHRLGTAYYLGKRYSAATEAMQQALQAYSKLGNEAGMAAMLLNLGVLGLRSLDDLDAVRDHFEQALHLQRTAGNRQVEAIGLVNLSACAFLAGNYLQAVELATTALALAEELRHKRFQSMAYAAMANAYTALGDFAQAKICYDKALAQTCATGHYEQHAYTLRGLADLALCTGDNKSAMDQARELRSLVETLHSHFSGDMWRIQGHDHMARQELSSAAAAYQQAVQSCAASPQPYLQMEPLAGLAAIALAEGRLTDALAYVERIWPWWQPARLAANPHPEWIYLTVYRVLQAGNDPRAADILRQAQAYLHERASRLADPAMRQRFFNATVQRQEILNLARS